MQEMTLPVMVHADETGIHVDMIADGEGLQQLVIPWLVILGLIEGMINGDEETTTEE